MELFAKTKYKQGLQLGQIKATTAMEDSRLKTYNNNCTFTIAL